MNYEYDSKFVRFINANIGYILLGLFLLSGVWWVPWFIHR